jgi:hypothetical protein
VPSQDLGNPVSGLPVPVEMLGRVRAVLDLTPHRRRDLMAVVSDRDDVASPFSALLPITDVDRGNA